MKESKRLARNKKRLRQCYSVFAKSVADVIADLERAGFRPRIQAAWRSTEEQLEKFNKGRSKVKFGFHNLTGADGRKESLAVDLLDDDAPLHPSKEYVLRLAMVARDHGLRTGIAWGLKKRSRARTLAAIDNGDVAADVKIGFDPTHLEVTGLSIGEAKQGGRPLRRGAQDEILVTEVPPSTQPPLRKLLVRSVAGPVRVMPGKTATYRATDFNLSDPTQAEKAKINWEIRRDGQPFDLIHEGGDNLNYLVSPTLAGSSVRVMPFRNTPTPRVSVVTRIGTEQPQVSPIAPVHGLGVSPHVVQIETRIGKVFARIDGGDRFFVGSDVRFRGNRGLMNTTDDSGARYNAGDYRNTLGFWADFLHPTALCESNGFFHRLNTYDRARFTFGFFQLAAHTPGDNLVLFLRELLRLPAASAYFPDLLLMDGRIHRQTDSGTVALETADTTQPLMEYLNPSRGQVDEVEAINAAKFIHWSRVDPAHRDLQVSFAVNQFKAKMGRYDRRYDLDGIIDTVCLVVADIRHQGRARSRTIIDALQSDDPLGNLLHIGEDGFPRRIATLRRAIEAGVNAGTLGRHVYDRGSKDFVAVP